MNTTVTAQPLLRIRPATGWASFSLRELWQFRDLLVVLAARDVKLRYRQTALGVAWVIFQPVLAAGIFSFVFGTVAKLPSGGVPHFVFAYAGLLAWNAFSGTLTKASSALVGNSQLVSKVYFPRLILPLSSVPSSLIDFAVAMVVMVVLLAAYRIAPGAAVFLLPVWLVLILLLALGLGLLAGALMVSYRDVQYVLPVLVPFLLYASPVAYPASAVPQRLQPVYFLNPLSGLLEGFRWSLLGEGPLHWGYAGYGAAAAVVLFAAGAVVFKRMERRFADVI